MRCPHCDREIPDEATFCPMCGKPVASAPDEAASDKAAPGGTEQGRDSAPSSSDSAGTRDATGTRDAAGDQGIVSSRQSPQQQSRQEEPPSGSSGGYRRGCLGAAWHDVRTLATRGKLLLLALLNCIPIVNFFVDGYTLNWSSEVPYGGRTRFPRRAATVRNFKIGFFMFLIGIVFYIILEVLIAIFSFIPVVGAIIAIILALLYYMFYYLAGMRMAMSQLLGEGFAFGKLWGAMRRNFSSMFCISIVPMLITAIIGVVIVLALLSAFFGWSWITLLSGMLNDMASGDVDSANNIADSLFSAVPLGTMTAFSVVMIVFAYVYSLLIVYAKLVTVRAVGHYIGRHVEEWTHEFPVPQQQPPSPPSR